MGTGCCKVQSVIEPKPLKKKNININSTNKQNCQQFVSYVDPKTKRIVPFLKPIKRNPLYKKRRKTEDERQETDISSFNNGSGSSNKMVSNKNKN